MLIDFKVKNYKSFRDGFDFSMIAKPRISDIEYSLLKNTLTNKNNILCSSVIYGPNSAGKTSIIQAFTTFKDIVLNGSIVNPSKTFSFLDNNSIELCPFAYDEKPNTIQFDITFEKNNKIFEYDLEFLVGTFGDISFKRKITKELLIVNGKKIFERDNNHIELETNNVKLYPINDGVEKGKIVDMGKYLEVVSNIINNNLDETKLFLTTDYPSFISKILFNEIIDFFRNDLLIFNKFSNLVFNPDLNDNEFIEMSNHMFKAANEIGSISSKINYVQEKDKPKLVSNIGNRLIDSREIESVGTLHFIDLYPALYRSLKYGAALIIDELDKSLHPMVVMSIVNLFHNPEINKNKAQIIFNSHNPVYLNNSIFRRDEMCFVEKNHETKKSEFYKLSDFGANSSTPTRKTTDYLNNYFLNKYGALEFVDLSDTFMEALKSHE